VAGPGIVTGEAQGDDVVLLGQLEADFVVEPAQRAWAGGLGVRLGERGLDRDGVAVGAGDADVSPGHVQA
jgi:hypothetical protein